MKLTLVYAVALYVYGKYWDLSYENTRFTVKDHNNSSVWFTPDPEQNMYSTCEGCFPAAHGHFSLGQVDKNIDGYVSSPLLSALNPGAHPTLPALPHDCSPHCRVCCVQARTAVVQQAPLSSAIWHYYVTNRTAGEITKIYQASLVPSCVHWCGVNTESRRWGEAKMEVQYQSGAEKV